MRRSLPLLVVAVALAVACLCSASSARAASTTYGPWYQQPSNNTTLKDYDGTVLPFESDSQSEITNFTCTFNDGTPITSAQQSALSGIITDASAAYNGSLQDGNTHPSGYGQGAGGMDNYLQDAKQFLEGGRYTRFSDYSGADGATDPIGTDMKFNTNYLHQASSQVLNINNDITARQKQLTPEIQQVINGELADQHRSVSPDDVTAIENLLANYDPPPQGTPASMVKHTWAQMQADYHSIITDQNTIQTLEQNSANGTPPDTVSSLLNTSAANVVQLYNNIPEGCGFDPIQQDNLKFIDIITNTGTFFQDLIFYLPSKAASGAYTFLQPYAFRFTFWTPHTERGDTMFSVAASCTPVSSMSGATAAQRAAQTIADEDQCAGSTPLGYTNPGSPGFDTTKAPWYIDIALFMEWLVSGFYFVILFAAAVLYMVRGNKNSHFHVLQLIPKLLASAILTVLSPYIIGELITFSNDLVTALFSYQATSGSSRSVGEITAIVGQSTTYLAGAGSFIAQLVQIVIGLWVSAYFALFIIGSLLRQVALIGFVIFAPVANFCFMNPRWQHHFSRYWRAVIAVIFTPPAMALVLKVGITINPIVAANGNISGTMGVTGLLLLVATLWAVNKTMRIGYAVARNNPALVGGMTGKALGQVGSMASLAAATGVAGPFGTAMLKGGGALASGAGRLNAAGDGMTAKLVPQGTMLGAGGGSKGALAAPGQNRHALPALGGSGFDRASSAMGGAAHKQMTEWIKLRAEQPGEKRLSSRMASAYRQKESQDARSHGEASGDSSSRASDAFYAANGTLVRRGGSNFLRREETSAPARSRRPNSPTPHVASPERPALLASTTGETSRSNGEASRSTTTATRAARMRPQQTPLPGTPPSVRRAPLIPSSSTQNGASAPQPRALPTPNPAPAVRRVPPPAPPQDELPKRRRQPSTTQAANRRPE